MNSYPLANPIQNTISAFLKATDGSCVQIIPMYIEDKKKKNKSKNT